MRFPDTSNPGDSVNTNSPSNNIGTNLEGILNQLSNDIDNNTGNIEILAKNNMNVQKSIQDISSALDWSYMIGMAAIGIGGSRNCNSCCSFFTQKFMKNNTDERKTYLLPL